MVEFLATRVYHPLFSLLMGSNQPDGHQVIIFHDSENLNELSTLQVSELTYISRGFVQPT